MSMKLGRRMSAVLLGSAFVLATPVAAMANDGPTYEVTRSGANSAGSFTNQTTTCAGSNGEQSSYERTTTRSNAKGESTTVVRTGDQAACDQASVDSSSTQSSSGSSMSRGESTMSRADNVLGELLGVGVGNN